MIVHGGYNSRKQEQEQRVLARLLAGVEQVFPAFGGQGPVVVLTAAVHSGKGLFMQQAYHAVLGGYALHQLHYKLVMVSCAVCPAEHGRKLVLPGRYLFMLGFCKHAQLPQFPVQLRHERLHAGIERAVIMVVQLLALGALRAEKRPAAEHKVPALCPKRLIHKEVFLLRAYAWRNALYILPAHGVHKAQRFFIDKLGGAQQRRFFVQRVAVI